MRYNDSSIQYNNGDREEKLVDMISKLCNTGFSPLITNNFSSWNFLHNFGVNLHEDPLEEPHGTLELQILNCVLNSQSFHYWDDEYPSETVDGLVVLYVKLMDGAGIEIVNKTMNMPVIYSMVCMKDNNYQWHFDSLVVNDGCGNENAVDGRSDEITNFREYDISIQIDSPKQIMALSTRDRVRRANRFLFQTWEFD